MNFFSAKITSFNWLSRKNRKPKLVQKKQDTPQIRVSKSTTDTLKNGRRYFKSNGSFTINEKAMKKLGLLSGDKVVIGVDPSSRKVAFKKSGEDGYTLSGKADKEAGLTTMDVRGTHAKSTVKFPATGEYLDLIGDAFNVELSDCEIDGDTVIITCPDVEEKVEISSSTTAKIGRPRKYKPSNVRVSDNEERLFNLAIDYAKENDTSFEKAFCSVIKTEEGSKLYLDVRDDTNP